MKEVDTCPFCGSEAELIVTDESWAGPSLILVKCKNGPCSCQTPTLIKPRKTDLLYTTLPDNWSREDAVIKIWNRREPYKSLSEPCKDGEDGDNNG